VITWSPSAGRTWSKPLRKCHHSSFKGSKIAIVLHRSQWSSDDIEVLQALAHEMIHATLAPAAGHRGEFARLAEAIGLEGPATATRAGERFRIAIQRLRAELPNLPQDGIALDRPGKQGTRLRLWECACKPPIKVRVSRDDFRATCDVCGCTFTMRGSSPPDAFDEHALEEEP
jgi:hypothetical protein